MCCLMFNYVQTNTPKPKSLVHVFNPLLIALYHPRGYVFASTLRR